MSNVLTFEIDHINGGALSLMPCIDDIPLSKLVSEFERSQGYNDPAGGHGGIIPSYIHLGPLHSYFLGNSGLFEDSNKVKIYALFCECGEAGCWPFIAELIVNDKYITWTGFSQPYRPARSYSDFGPFIFTRPKYEQAVAIAANFLNVD